MKIRVCKPSEIPKSWYGSEIGFDLETSSGEFDSHICLASFYNPDENVALVVGLDFYVDNVHIIASGSEREYFRNFLESIKSVGHYLQFDFSKVYQEFGVLMKASFDSFILSRMLQQPVNALKEIARRLFPDKSYLFSDFENVVDVESGEFQYHLDDPKTVQYSALDAVLPFRIRSYYSDYVKKFSNVMAIECGFIPSTVLTRVNGILVDMGSFRKIQESITNDYHQKVSNFSGLVGFPFRCNAAADISRVVIDRLGLTPTLMTKRGAYSMSSEALILMMESTDNVEAKKLIKEILDLKHMFSVVNSIKKVPDVVGSDGAIHPKVEQIGFDASSRVYTKDPSIQQFPSEFRSCVIPSPGHKFLYADWSSAELYIMSYLAGCKSMLDVYHSGGDLHTENAKKMLGLTEVTSEQRDICKTVTFATMYGSTGAAVSRNLCISNEEGSALVQKYMDAFPEIKDFRDKCYDFAVKFGFTTTIFGRRRVLEGIHSSDGSIVEENKRRSFNTKIQSSCADLYKLAVARSIKFLDRDITFVVGVFDSFLFEVPENFTDAQAVSLFDSIFEFSSILKDFKLNYKWSFGKTWKECQENS